MDVLVLNAGVMGSPEYRVTKEGSEEMFGANHLGHFLLANLIIGKVLKGGEERKGGRVVSVSSDGYRLSPVRFEDLGFDVSPFSFSFLRIIAVWVWNEGGYETVVEAIAGD